VTDAERVIVAARRTTEINMAGLAALEAALGGALGAAMQHAVDLVVRARGRVIVTGMGKSGHIARKIAATLASTGTPAFFMHPAEASHGDLGMVTSDDVILALSWSGETVELRDVIHYSRRYDVPLIAMTAGAESALARNADAALLLPKVEEACPHGLAPTTSTLIQLALGDALAMALLERRGFTAEHFRQFHPGGKLGAQLLKVSELMHRAPDIPLVRTDADMAAAILAMTKHRLGCVVVQEPTGQLAGIITDGDLTRHMSPGLLEKPVSAVMTTQPRTIAPGQLASAALKEMNTRKITALVVIEGGKPTGLLHMHALLAAGIA